MSNVSGQPPQEPSPKAEVAKEVDLEIIQSGKNLFHPPSGWFWESSKKLWGKVSSHGYRPLYLEVSKPLKEAASQWLSAFNVLESEMDDGLAVPPDKVVIHYRTAKAAREATRTHFNIVKQQTYEKEAWIIPPVPWSKLPKWLQDELPPSNSLDAVFELADYAFRWSRPLTNVLVRIVEGPEEPWLYIDPCVKRLANEYRKCFRSSIDSSVTMKWESGYEHLPPHEVVGWSAEEWKSRALAAHEKMMVCLRLLLRNCSDDIPRSAPGKKGRPHRVTIKRDFSIKIAGNPRRTDGVKKTIYTLWLLQDLKKVSIRKFATLRSKAVQDDPDGTHNRSGHFDKAMEGLNECLKKGLKKGLPPIQIDLHPESNHRIITGLKITSEADLESVEEKLQELVDSKRT